MGGFAAQFWGVLIVAFSYTRDIVKTLYSSFVGLEASVHGIFYGANYVVALKRDRRVYMYNCDNASEQEPPPFVVADGLLKGHVPNIRTTPATRTVPVRVFDTLCAEIFVYPWNLWWAFFCVAFRRRIVSYRIKREKRK